MPTRQGTVAPEVSRAYASGLLDLGARSPTGVSATQNRWYVPVIMVGFSDYPLTFAPANFDTALFDTSGITPTGSVFDYYQWASSGRLRVTGKVVATVNLPFPRDYYANDAYGLNTDSTPYNLYGMVRDALQLCASSVDWSPFDVDHDGTVDMLWVIHQGMAAETAQDRTTFWSITSRMSSGWHFGSPYTTTQLLPGTSNRYFQIDRFTSLPELSTMAPGKHAEIGTFCHEFGHALGLPDLYDVSGFTRNVGPGNWSLMSTGGYGGMGSTPQRPAGLGGWCSLFLGWATSTRPQQDTTITLRPMLRGDPLIEAWTQGESHPEHFLIENRKLESFDSTLPASGLIITHLDQQVIDERLAANAINAGFSPGYVMVEADGGNALFRGFNRGDADDPFPGSTHRTFITDEGNPSLITFAGARTNLALGGIVLQGENVQFRLQVRQPGWLAPASITPPDPVFLDSPRPARWAATDPQERVFAVRSELRAGIPQIVLYSRLANVWQPAEVISHSNAAAFDPAIAVLPGGDLAVVWTDVRDGHSRIFYTARIRGQWLTETPISNVSGDSHHAAMGTDASGMVEVAWLNDLAGQRQLCFKRFAYLSPFGTPSPVTFTNEEPDPPTLAVRPDGSAILVWSDRASTPARLFFSRFDPDSGVSPRQTLTYTPAAPMLGVSAAFDRFGTLHTVWQVSGAGISELHYQPRPQYGALALPDTLLESSGVLVQNPSVSCDDSLGVHVVYEDWSGPLPVVRYKLMDPQLGWDAVGTVVAPAGEGALQPAILPHGPGNVTLLESAQTSSDYGLVEMRRVMGTDPTSAAPLPVLAGPGLQLGPNPLRAGAALHVSGRMPAAAAWLDVFDLAGRRIAAVPATMAGGVLSATVDARLTARWSSGVYFARPRGIARSARFVVIR